ncbi:hypothetical protein NM688_g5721 [Phlebia brevispora]|uniref:Uncharacterized protein n=1 Tax=Phlebia brevispora TaxID=194682 RepID=A0ACC1SQM9_9APHY|nr:hypothetical protein NM688_g5721 [Phlebia brevispora]
MELVSFLHMLKKLGLEVDEARRVALDKEPVMLHCVRCHAGYTEKDNGATACPVEHDVDDEGERVGPDEYEYTCSFCEEVGTEDGAGNGIDWENSVCYEATHTTDKQEVEYDSRTVLTCEENGCTRQERDTA